MNNEIQKIINFYKEIIKDANFDLSKINESNFPLYNFDNNVKGFIDWFKKTLLRFDEIKSYFDIFINQNLVSESINNFNKRSLMLLGPNFVDQSVCDDLIIKKVIFGVTDRIFYYKDRLIHYLNMYPIFHFKLKNDETIYLNNMFLDWYSMIDKMLFNIWAIRKNRKKYNENKKVCDAPRMGLFQPILPNQNSLITSPFFLKPEEKNDLTNFQNNAFSDKSINETSLFNSSKFWTSLRNDLIHNEITSNQMFNEMQLGHNVSFFDTIFIYYTCRLIYGTIELLNKCFESIND